MIQARPTSQPMRCDSDPKIHLPVSLVAKVHPMMHQEGGTKEAVGTAGTLGEAQQSPPPPHPPALTPMTDDQDPRRGDPSGSDVPACALRCGPPGAPDVAGGVHADDEIQGRDVMENTGPGAAEECLTPHPGCGAETLSDQGSPVPLAQRPPQVLLSGQNSEMSSPIWIVVWGRHALSWHLFSPAQMAHTRGTTPPQALKQCLGIPTPCLLQSVCG